MQTTLVQGQNDLPQSCVSICLSVCYVDWALRSRESHNIYFWPWTVVIVCGVCMARELYLDVLLSHESQFPGSTHTVRRIGLVSCIVRIHFCTLLSRDTNKIPTLSSSYLSLHKNSLEYIVSFIFLLTHPLRTSRRMCRDGSICAERP